MGKVHDLNKRLDAVRYRRPSIGPKVHRIAHEAHETVEGKIAAGGLIVSPGDILIVRKIVDVA